MLLLLYVVVVVVVVVIVVADAAAIKTVAGQLQHYKVKTRETNKTNIIQCVN